MSPLINNLWNPMHFIDNEKYRVKIGLAEMLKGGVIMDVTTAEQARIAEDAGACAVMALERVPPISAEWVVLHVWLRHK